VSIYTNNGERGELVDGVATLEKLANGGAPSKIVTKLANGATPLVNGENGERSRTAQIYFQGICAEYVSQNLALVTAASSLTATAIVAGLVTTIDVYTTIIIPST
jgi:hypothetical protein